MKILVIIPAYNEEETILNVIKKLNKDCKRADYIVINDCSTDHTLVKLKEANASYLNLPLNLGIGGGVQAGYKYAYENGYDIAIQIDGDGQHDTAYLEKVIAPIENGEADIVIGSRFITKEGFQSSGMRRFGIKFLSTLIRICCGTKVQDVTSGFRAVNRKGISLYAKDYPVDYPEPEAIVKASVMGYRIKEVPVIMKEREAGESSISPFKSIYYMIKVSVAIVICRISSKKVKKHDNNA
ncbi:MAG: glycosyltransferase family 2 protein [Lachnospiraceae bacterium]